MDIKAIVLSGLLISSFNINAEQDISSSLNDFYEKYHKQQLFFDSQGALEFEYICTEPTTNIDCRQENIEHLQEVSKEKFVISNLLYVDDQAFFEIQFEKQGTYFILAKRIINGLNETYFYSTSNVMNDLIISDPDMTHLTFGKEYDITKKVILCGELVKFFSCDLPKYKTYENGIKIKINDYSVIDDRKVINIYIKEEQKNYWIDEYILKSLIK